MSEALQRLHRDHANAFRLLVLRDRQIEVMDGGKRADWDIVQGVIHYFLTYPDTGHHPLEDAILARLRAKHPEAAEPFLWLDHEHRQLSDTLHHMASVTQRLVPVVRATYLDLLRSFVEGQRNHIQREEGGFLPTARRLLDAGDWKALDLIAAKVADPLADHDDHRFRALRKQLASVPQAHGHGRQANEGA